VETSRRGFLAAMSAAVPGAADAADQPQEHQHQLVPSDISLRVKSLESLLVEKGLVDPAALDALFVMKKAENNWKIVSFGCCALTLN
jgi:hypothetical protein